VGSRDDGWKRGLQISNAVPPPPLIVEQVLDAETVRITDQRETSSNASKKFCISTVTRE
jgi:hypothetical protein